MHWKVFMRRMSLSRCLLRFRLSLHVLGLTLMVLTLQPLHSAVGDDLHGRMDQTFLDDLVRKNWDTADGLPGMTITSLMQDRKGYVWIGTYDGLVRFDGVEFTTYSRSTDENYDFASARSLIQDSK